MDRALPAEENLQDDDREERLLSMVGMAKERRLNEDGPPDALARTMKDCNAGGDKAFGKAREFLRPYGKFSFSARVVPKTGGACRRREGPRQVPDRE